MASTGWLRLLADGSRWRVLDDYRRRAARDVRLGRPLPPITASIEEAVGFASIQARVQEER